MLRSLCSMPRNYAIISNKCSRNVFINSIRLNTNVAHAFKAKRYQKKEPGELIKWVLFVSIPISLPN